MRDARCEMRDARCEMREQATVLGLCSIEVSHHLKPIDATWMRISGVRMCGYELREPLWLRKCYGGLLGMMLMT